MKKILLIDDELLLLRMVSSRLRANGYVPLTASSGGQGLKLAKEERPDLILLDRVMPEMNGDEVLARLKKDRATRSIPVVMFTADLKRVKVGDYQRRGAAGCLFKPFVPGILLAKIEEILGPNA